MPKTTAAAAAAAAALRGVAGHAAGQVALVPCPLPPPIMSPGNGKRGPAPCGASTVRQAQAQWKPCALTCGWGTICWTATIEHSRHRTCRGLGSMCASMFMVQYTPKLPKCSVTQQHIRIIPLDACHKQGRLRVVHVHASCCARCLCLAF